MRLFFSIWGKNKVRESETNKSTTTTSKQKQLRGSYKRVNKWVRPYSPHSPPCIKARNNHTGLQSKFESCPVNIFSYTTTKFQIELWLLNYNPFIATASTSLVFSSPRKLIISLLNVGFIRWINLSLFIWKRFPDGESFFMDVSKVFDPKYVFTIYFPVIFALQWAIGIKLLGTIIVVEWLNQILKW